MSTVWPYRQIDVIEAGWVAAKCDKAWIDSSIPMQQYESFVKKEVADFRAGKSVVPFDALIRCLRHATFGVKASLLDVGASSGYYGEVLKIGGFDFEYSAVDYSEAFMELAQRLYPGIHFDVGDARALPYFDGAFDIVLSGCCLLHIKEYGQVIRETARVSQRYAVFSKTPVILGGDTIYYEKQAYGIPCLEIHFGEAELLGLFERHGLSVIHYEDGSQGGGLVHRTYLTEKVS